MTKTEEPNFATIANIFGSDTKPQAKRGNVARARLLSAYQSIFSGRGSKEDADLVFVDLAKFTGYLNTTSPETPDQVLRYCEGQRSVFGRIQSFLNPSPSAVRALSRAVEDELRVDAQFGELHV